MVMDAIKTKSINLFLIIFILALVLLGLDNNSHIYSQINLQINPSNFWALPFIGGLTLGRKKLLIIFPLAIAIAIILIQPISGQLGFDISNDYFRLILLLLVVVMVALLSERIERVRSLRQLNKELRIQAEKLEDANQELEAFAYSVSHDLRVPLRAIDGFSRIVIEDYEDKLDEEGIRLLGVIRENTKKMGQLIDDILLLSRASRQEMNLIELDMNALSEAVYLEFANQTENRPINFQVEKLPKVYGDRSLIYQVFINLIGNSIKFTRNINPAEIIVGSEEGKDDYVYYVKDNGAGFDMKYINKLFGLFQRLHSPQEFEGTGVGLSIVQRIIKRHGGNVWGEGAVGEGATIYFSLPKKKQSKDK
jgi:light-regulated signal transduction histidine kinase (bacteriophytochrome)